MRRIVERLISPLCIALLGLASTASQGKPHLSFNQVVGIAAEAAQSSYPQDPFRWEAPQFDDITKVWLVSFWIPGQDNYQKRFDVFVFDATGHSEVNCAGLRFAGAPFDKKNLPAEVQPFVDDGQRVRDLNCADLNGDGRSDFALLTEGHDVLTGRTLKILLRGQNGALTAVVNTSNVVQSPAEDGMTGMPRLLARRNRIEVINHSGGMHGSSDLDLYFEYSVPDNTWLLTRAERTIDGEHAGDETDYTQLPKDFGHVTLADFDLKKFDH
jgi:hypothetical protein